MTNDPHDHFANLVGAPEWLTDEEAALYSAAIQEGLIKAEPLSTAREQAAADTEQRIARLIAAARYYWTAADAARRERRWAAMRALADQAKGAEHAASPEGRLIGAVFDAAPEAETRAEDGRVWGIRGLELVCAAEMPRARNDWPAYLASQAKPIGGQT